MIALQMRRALRQGIGGTIALLIGIFIFECIVPPVAEDVGTEQLDPVFESLPPAFQAITRASPDLIIGSGVQGYLTIGFTSPVFLLMICAGILTFTSGLAGEIQRGTIELALSRGNSRTSVYLSRVFGSILLAVLFAVVGPLGVLAGLLTIDHPEAVDRTALIPTAIGIFALLFAVAGVTMLLSALGSRSGQVVGWAISWLVISYFIDYFATLWSALEPLTPLSVFNYFEPAATVIRSDYSVGNLVVLGVVGLIEFVAGAVIFERRDLPT